MAESYRRTTSSGDARLPPPVPVPVPPLVPPPTPPLASACLVCSTSSSVRATVRSSLRHVRYAWSKPRDLSVAPERAVCSLVARRRSLRTPSSASLNCDEQAAKRASPASGGGGGREGGLEW